MAKTMRNVAKVRYQVMTDTEIWNYGKDEEVDAHNKLAELKKRGYKATLWNTLDNPLNNMMSGLFGGRRRK